MIPEIEIRPIVPADFQDIFRIYSDKEILKLTDSALHQSIEDSKNLINWFYNGENNKTHIYRGVVLKNDNIIIGVVGLYHIDWKHLFASISCILDKKYWRKGIMTKVLKELIVFSFDDIKLNRLEAQVYEFHEGSVNLFKKLKFSKEALLRRNFLIDEKFENSYLFTLLKHEYQENKEFYCEE
ncbi:MAG: hypothetical protein A2033_08610 [Bacteroidetes bacterium GWA2_31_9]|nr:MAG: hypothetical protein A2033_08610 [Bacteroidetes bacterium GWA2_31_9]